MQLGKCNYDEITKKIDEIKKENSNEINENNEEIKGVKIMPYIFNMEEVLNIADLAICRSGAMTVTEILKVGIPAIFVPLPSENSNKQSLNAEIFIENRREIPKGAYIILSKDKNSPTTRNLMIIYPNKEVYKCELKVGKNTVTRVADVGKVNCVENNVTD